MCVLMKMAYQVYTFIQVIISTNNKMLMIMTTTLLGTLFFHYPSKCNFRVSKLRWLIQSKSQWHSQNNFEIVIALIWKAFNGPGNVCFNVIIEFSELIFSIIKHKALNVLLPYFCSSAVDTSFYNGP